ncbi:hypothetical protein C8250_018725 [Streptomyces sp. So13.3]|uniref:DUF7544 domain-containing protein n=1 Tax=Streptomyces TaxID=1883 RepID=UPI001105AAB7|nr:MULTISPECIES: glycerophosphoryl diester phosphodiesterase membrane domain-containing protein [Streptomyces]MCZ4102425.1 glycerophosphoryl diester phosphodiesterase membrane domain-containing protein [Streptomyces sp. H39-C1]QNA73681.1 hypothetical protein C8250_018725 [Streptomyces sp. So13.3]
MNDTPGWASPGSSDSDEPERGDSPQAPPPPPAPQDAAPNWSKQQPPPDQWSAPAGGGWGSPPPPPPQPGPGWGGAPGGWQSAPWGRPPAAKPGVIPLRPLGVGEILDGAVSTMRAHWRVVLGISLAVALVTQAVLVVLQGLFLNENSDFNQVQKDPNATSGEILRSAGGALAGSGIAALISLLAMIFATAMLTMVISRAVLGRPVTTGEAWRDSRPQLLRLLGLTLLLPLIALLIIAAGTVPGIVIIALGGTGGGIALAVIGGLAASVVAIWLSVRWSLASPTLMLEKQGVITSMKRSMKLVRGAWWRILGVQLLAWVLVTIVSMIIQTPFTLIAGAVSGDGMTSFMSENANLGWTFLIVTAIGGVIGTAITLPISAGVTALLYMDQRIRREALDIELARAAGLPGYGDTRTPDRTTPES